MSDDTSKIGEVSGRLINGGKNARANGFRLSDIAKLIAHRHGGPCRDPVWSRTYFLAALPHVISSRARWREAVRAWVEQWTPTLLIADFDWAEGQIERCLDTKRPHPRTDKLAKLLAVRVDEVGAAKLVSIPAASRTKQVRQAEAKAKRAERDRKRWAASHPNHTPHAQSKARTKPWEACGMKRSAWYAAGQPRPESTVEQVSVCAVPVLSEAVSEQAVNDVLDGNSPHITGGGPGRKFTLHPFLPETRESTSQQSNPTVNASGSDECQLRMIVQGVKDAASVGHNAGNVASR